MSLSSALFGSDSFIHKATNILGLGIPGWLDKQFGAKEAEPQIRTLGELSQQTAKEAEPRPIVWGRVRPIGGNIIHCQAPVTRMITTTVDGGGGKGGKKKKQKQTTQHVYRTYAIGVCEGPITGYTRIWRNNKLVYDARGNAWGEANNPVFLRQFRLYLGGWGQLPDPTLQAIWGVGNVPAYRGTAYIVSIDEDLTDLAGSVPQFIFEVERAEGSFLTSRPYSVESVEAVDLSQLFVKESPNAIVRDAVNLSQVVIISGSLRDTIQTYEVPPDGVELSQVNIIDGSLVPQVYHSYTVPPEGVELSQVSVIGGTLKDVVIQYDNYPPEGVELSQVVIVQGSLT